MKLATCTHKCNRRLPCLSAVLSTAEILVPQPGLATQPICTMKPAHSRSRAVLSSFNDVPCPVKVKHWPNLCWTRLMDSYSICSDELPPVTKISSTSFEQHTWVVAIRFRLLGRLQWKHELEWRSKMPVKHSSSVLRVFLLVVASISLLLGPSTTIFSPQVKSYLKKRLRRVSSFVTS